jgi:hypothetical protein
MRVALVRGTTLLAFGFAGQQAWATGSPQDPCSLLTAVQVSSTLADQYVAQEKSVAPRPFANTVQGTDCHYKTASGLKTFYSEGSTPAAVGDEAYIDKNNAIHVRKGNVRYFLTISHGDTPSGCKQILALAALVAGEL